MMKKNVRKYLNSIVAGENGGMTFKYLSAAVLVGMSSFCVPAMAEQPLVVDSSEIDFESLFFDASKNLTWQKVNSAGDNTIKVNLPNQDTKYYLYTYTKPDNYTEISQPISSLDSSLNINPILINEQSHSGYNNYITNPYDTDNSNINITGDFVNNSLKYSAIICNEDDAKLGNITGTFINNTTNSGYYGLITNTDNAVINDITGEFIGNKGSNIIRNDGTINSINADFIGNSSTVIYNSGTIKSLKGTFINNGYIIESYAILGTVENVSGVFINNGSLQGVNNITNSTFINNGSSVVNNTVNNFGRYHKDSWTLNIKSSNFINNIGHTGGAINSASLVSWVDDEFHTNIEDSIFTGNIASQGGAISAHTSSHLGHYKDKTYTLASNSLNIKNSIFISNGVGAGDDAWVAPTSESEDGEITYAGNYCQGGAIYSDINTNIIADNGNTIFTGNYVKPYGEEKVSQAIFMVDATLRLSAQNNGKIIMNDGISGAYLPDSVKDRVYNLEITGDSTGIVEINDTVDAKEAVKVEQITYTTVDSDLKTPVDISLEKTNLYLGRDNVFDNNNLTLKSGFMSMVNNQAGISALNQMTITGDTNFVADVDLNAKEMDRFTATSYGKHQGNLNVVGMNLLSDAKEDKTEIYFAEQGLKDNVTTTVKEVAYSPIYKYNVSYSNRDDGGYFVFNRGGGAGANSSGSAGGNASDSFNPAVLSAPVSSIAASQATVNETFKYVFEHADTFTKMPSMDRMTKINTNKYALSTDFDENRELIGFDHNNTAGWFRPYVTFEKMSLNHGPKVDAVTYGSLAGFDTDFHEHRNGWYSVGTGYVGYNGSQLHYNGVSTTMNGGLLGYTHTMYKGNFWSALTLSAGASVGESRTMYGKEDFTSLMAGLGSKTGYNFEFKEGKYILQPIMFMSYTFVNTFDYTNAAGVRVKPSPAHSIQLNPSVRFITNTKNGWQPYVSAGVVWNVMNENKVLANNVRLPEMSMKPYVEYGVGVQRNWKDKFTAFGQAMLRNGGRNGIALTGGFRWALGKDTHHSEKVQNGTQVKERTVLKQLTSSQKTALGARAQNTTRTTSSAVLKNI